MLIIKSSNSNLEKAKALPIGTIRGEGANKRKKTANGKWVYVAQGRNKKAEEDTTSRKKAEPKKKPAPSQPVKDLDAIFKLVEESIPDFNKFVAGLAKATGADEVKTRPTLKSRGRIAKKVQEYDGDFSRIIDINGATLIFDDPKAVTKFFDEVQKIQPPVVRIKDRYSKAATGGYRDYLTNIEMPNGAIVEILATNRGMYNEKEHGVGHQIYEVVRVLPEKEHLTPIVDSLVGLSEVAYGASEANRKASSSVISTEWSKTLPLLAAAIGTDLPEDVRRASWMPSFTTGTSSQSKNIFSDIAASIDSIAQKASQIKEEVKKALRMVCLSFPFPLGKSSKLPDGTRRKYGTNWYIKMQGTWVYDGREAPKRKTANVGARSKIRAAAKTPAAPAGPMPGLVTFTPAEADALNKKFTRRDRMGYGQMVKYDSNYHKGRKGTTGKLVAIGRGGFAAVQFSDGEVLSAGWADIKATGGIQAHSLYDNIDSKNIHKVTGALRDKVNEIMDQPIGSSGYTYQQLCYEFSRRGFNLQVVGGTCRDILSGADEVKDIDFIFNGTDKELTHIIKAIKPEWLATAVTNSHIGLCSFTDKGCVVDITPVHKYSPELKDMAKGWSLKEDAESRDVAMNTIQMDTISGVMVDATGKGIEDIKNKTINFSSSSHLKVAPRYVLRSIKFLGRGYAISPESEDLLKKNLPYTANISPSQRHSFIKRQIYDKDGKKGLDNFKRIFQKYNRTLWNKEYQSAWESVYKRAR